MSVKSTQSRGGPPPTLKYTKDVESHLRITPELDADAELTGLVTASRSSGGVRFYTLRDATGSIQLIAERDDLLDNDWAAVCEIRQGDFVSVAGRVGLSRRGEVSLYLRRGPTVRDGSLASPISNSPPDYQAVGAQILLARLRHRAAEFFREAGYLEIEPKFISTDWRFQGLEPMRVVYPGFGAAAFLAPSPATQLLDALVTTGSSAVFASSRCFSTTYRDERSSAESLIISSKAVDLRPGEHYDLIRRAVSFIFGELGTLPEADLYPISQWTQKSVTEILESHQGEDVVVPTLEIYRNPNIARGGDNLTVRELFRLVWPPRRTIAEGSQDVLEPGLHIGSTTIHIERMVSLLRDVPVRNIRNLS